MKKQIAKRAGFGDFLEELAEQNNFTLNYTPGQMLRANRERFGMTLKDLASVTGIREPNLSKLENDKSPMSPYYADIFSAAFGVPAPAFLYPNGEVEKTKELAAIKERMAKFTKGNSPRAPRRKSRNKKMKAS